MPVNLLEVLVNAWLISSWSCEACSAVHVCMYTWCVVMVAMTLHIANTTVSSSSCVVFPEQMLQNIIASVIHCNVQSIARSLTLCWPCCLSQSCIVPVVHEPTSLLRCGIALTTTQHGGRHQPLGQRPCSPRHHQSRGPTLKRHHRLLFGKGRTRSRLLTNRARGARCSSYKQGCNVQGRCMYVYTYVHMCVCMFVCMYTCMYMARMYCTAA